jgi:hypothetical protein
VDVRRIATAVVVGLPRPSAGLLYPFTAGHYKTDTSRLMSRRQWRRARRRSRRHRVFAPAVIAPAEVLRLVDELNSEPFMRATVGWPTIGQPANNLTAQSEIRSRCAT